MGNGIEIELESDLDILNAARNSVAYGGRFNSLVEWTLSPEWTTPLHGSISRTTVSGEITGKTEVCVLFKGGLLSSRKIGR